MFDVKPAFSDAGFFICDMLMVSMWFPVMGEL